MNPAHTYNLHNRGSNSTLSQNKYYDVNKLGGRRSTLGGENIYNRTQNSTANEYIQQNPQKRQLGAAGLSRVQSDQSLFGDSQRPLLKKVEFQNDYRTPLQSSAKMIL